MKKIKIYTILFIALQPILFLTNKSHAYTVEETFNKEKLIRPSIYSWESVDITNNDTLRDNLRIYKTLRINDVYQRISDFGDLNLKSHIKLLAENDISVYYLTGDPTWYAKPSSIITRINRIVTHNSSALDENEKIKGIVLDIEPWSLTDFNIDTYSQTLQEAYNHAKSVGVKMVIAIPFWLDASELEKIIPYCDRASVMNYTRNSTVSNMTDEISTAKKYNVEIENISETKAPNGAGIPDSITFYNYGLDAVNQEWLKLIMLNDDVLYSYHDLEAMKIMLNKYPNSLMIGKNLTFNALEKKDTEYINIAKDFVNSLLDSEDKNYLLNQLNSLNSVETLEKKNVTSNLDLYIKSENILSISIDTNQIMFDDFSGVEDEEKLNAVNITINSSLPYSLNAYLPTEIQNSDKSNIMDKEILNIKESSELIYKTFSNTTDKIVLKDNCASGNGLIHGIDIKLKGGIAHEKDVYKTTIKFEVAQK